LWAAVPFSSKWDIPPPFSRARWQQRISIFIRCLARTARETRYAGGFADDTHCTK
jgi:hypothetical protein